MNSLMDVFDDDGDENNNNKHSNKKSSMTAVVEDHLQALLPQHPFYISRFHPVNSETNVVTSALPISVGKPSFQCVSEMNSCKNVLVQVEDDKHKKDNQKRGSAIQDSKDENANAKKNAKNKKKKDNNNNKEEKQGKSSADNDDEDEENENEMDISDFVKGYYVESFELFGRPVFVQQQRQQLHNENPQDSSKSSSSSSKQTKKSKKSNNNENKKSHKQLLPNSPTSSATTAAIYFCEPLKKWVIGPYSKLPSLIIFHHNYLNNQSKLSPSSPNNNNNNIPECHGWLSSIKSLSSSPTTEVGWKKLIQKRKTTKKAKIHNNNNNNIETSSSSLNVLLRCVDPFSVEAAQPFDPMGRPRGKEVSDSFIECNFIENKATFTQLKYKKNPDGDNENINNNNNNKNRQIIISKSVVVAGAIVVSSNFGPKRHSGMSYLTATNNDVDNNNPNPILHSFFSGEERHFAVRKSNFTNNHASLHLIPSTEHSSSSPSSSFSVDDDVDVDDTSDNSNNSNNHKNEFLLRREELISRHEMPPFDDAQERRQGTHLSSTTSHHELTFGFRDITNNNIHRTSKRLFGLPENDNNNEEEEIITPPTLSPKKSDQDSCAAGALLVTSSAQRSTQSAQQYPRVQNSLQALVAESIFAENTAEGGAGALSFGNVHSVLIQSSSLMANTAIDRSGGAVRVFRVANLTLAHTHCGKNFAALRGGCIFANEDLDDGGASASANAHAAHNGRLGSLAKDFEPVRIFITRESEVFLNKVGESDTLDHHQGSAVYALSGQVTIVKSSFYKLLGHSVIASSGLKIVFPNGEERSDLSTANNNDVYRQHPTREGFSASRRRYYYPSAFSAGSEKNSRNHKNSKSGSSPSSSSSSTAASKFAPLQFSCLQYPSHLNGYNSKNGEFVAGYTTAEDVGCYMLLLKPSPMERGKKRSFAPPSDVATTLFQNPGSVFDADNVIIVSTTDEMTKARHADSFAPSLNWFTKNQHREISSNGNTDDATESRVELKTEQNEIQQKQQRKNEEMKRSAPSVNERISLLFHPEEQEEENQDNKRSPSLETDNTQVANNNNNEMVSDRVWWLPIDFLYWDLGQLERDSSVDPFLLVLLSEVTTALATYLPIVALAIFSFTIFLENFFIREGQEVIITEIE